MTNTIWSRAQRVRRGGRRWGGAILLLAMTVAAFGSTSVEAGAPRGGAQVRYGENVALGGGVVRTYVVLEEDEPVEVGVALSESVFAGLPADGAHGVHGGVVMPDGHSMFEVELPMPSGNGTPFEYVLVNWNPGGHEPQGTYDLPHFDFHFYTVGPNVRQAMNPESADFMTKGDHLPPTSMIPEGYVFFGPAVPFMGSHWMDPFSPELHPENPERFTQTFIYGSWAGEMIFVEPMVTRAVIESREQVRIPVRVPASFGRPGFYPASYEIRWDAPAREHRIALTDLAWRQ